MRAVEVAVGLRGRLVPRPQGVGNAVAPQREARATGLLAQAEQLRGRGDGAADLQVLVLQQGHARTPFTLAWHISMVHMWLKRPLLHSSRGTSACRQAGV